MKIKRFLCITFALLISLSSFFVGCTFSAPAYASSNEWQNTDLDDQAQAFLYYCKSRNLVIEGSVADALTSFTTSTYYKLCNSLGINITDLQSDIKKATDSNAGTKFLFTATGISAMNRIFAEFLQNNDLDVGDSVNDKTLYSGDVVYTNDGLAHLVYILADDIDFNSRLDDYSKILYYGTYVLYDNDYFINCNINGVDSWDFSVYIQNASIYPLNYRMSSGASSPRKYYRLKNSSNMDIFSRYQGTYNTNGECCVFRKASSSSYYFGGYSVTKENKYAFTYISPNPFTISDAENVNINITTNNQTINNNTYNNNTYTTINNEGDTYNYDTEPDPDDDPSGGGGGGGDDEPKPPIVDPTPTPEPDVPDDWDIELPSLGDQDWLLYGLEKKFPWSIPFDLMFVLSLLNAEPETPHFEGTLDLKYTQWDYDIDLSPFDTIAGYFREFFFLSFIIGLMFLTKQLIWG